MPDAASAHGSGWGNEPSMSEMIRRVQRLEDRMDARLVTIDVWQAKEASHAVEIAALQHRITQLETALSGATRLIVAAFLGLLVQFVVLGVALFGRSGG